MLFLCPSDVNILRVIVRFLIVNRLIKFSILGSFNLLAELGLQSGILLTNCAMTSTSLKKFFSFGTTCSTIQTGQ